MSRALDGNELVRIVPRRVIVCAAIRDADGHIICGPRHWDEIMCKQVAWSNAPWKTAEQGFVDQHGVFLNRKDARLVAWAANQVVRRCGGDDDALYSENLY